jgi:hypothetical protein
MAKRRRASTLRKEPEAKIVEPAPAEKYCTGCQAHHPLSAFLNSAFTRDKLTDSCRNAIWRTAKRDREAREKRLAELEAKAPPVAS